MLGPLILAHRGFHRSARENSVAAFAAAVGGGFDGVELDLHQTEDGELVVYHDDEVGGVPIASLELNELRAVLPASFAPELADVLTAVPQGLLIDVELKGDAAALAAAMLDGHNCVMTSFKADLLQRAATGAPQIKRGLILGRSPLHRQDPKELLRLARESTADFLVLDVPLADDSTLEVLADKLCPSYVWTPNTKADLTRLLRLPTVAAVITDSPDLAVRIRRPTPHATEVRGADDW